MKDAAQNVTVCCNQHDRRAAARDLGRVPDGLFASGRRDDRLRQRGLSVRRSLAVREFALGIKELERFVGNEPLRRVHEWVFGVLALESEPVDPRL